MGGGDGFLSSSSSEELDDNMVDRTINFAIVLTVGTFAITKLLTIDRDYWHRVRCSTEDLAPQDEGEKDLGVRAALSMLRFYKREITPLLLSSYYYVPTCSEYSMQAYKKYGVAKGTVLTAWRLCRCNPVGLIKAVIKCNGREAVTDFEPGSYEVEMLLDADSEATIHENMVKRENFQPPSGIDPFIESIVMLQAAQEALEMVVLHFRGVWRCQFRKRRDSVTCDGESTKNGETRDGGRGDSARSLGEKGY